MALSDHQSGSLLVGTNPGLFDPQKEVHSERRLPFSITNILNSQVSLAMQYKTLNLITVMISK
jgi:hypothetical protein